MSRQHKDVEFHIERPDGGFGSHTFHKFEHAAVSAIAQSASSGKPITIDVVVYSRAGANAWQGPHGVEVYNEDPDASVHERIIVRAESLGRIG